MAFDFLNKIATVTGLVGFAYAGYGAITFQPVPRFDDRLSMCDPTPAQWVQLARFGRQNRGEIAIVNVIVDFDAGNCATQESRRTYNQGNISSVGYWFSSRFGSNTLDPNLFPDNGLVVVFQEPQLMPNTLTRIQFDVEGLEDRVTGPMQVSFEGEDAANVLTFSPPNLNDTQARRVACTQKDWSRVRMALMCPLSNP